MSRLFRLAGGFGVSCSEAGLALAGVVLVRRLDDGFSPRPAGEIDQLLDAAYGGRRPAECSPSGLRAVADALNRSDLSRAMIASLRLNLSELDWDGAARLARTEQWLAKHNFNPAEARDPQGRWTGSGTSAPGAGRPIHLYGGRVIPIAGGPGEGIGGNGPPPEPELIPEREPAFDRIRIPEGWDAPGQVIDGLYYPPIRNPVLPNGAPWPRVDHDLVQAVLRPQPGRAAPYIVIFVPRDGVGPTLAGSTPTFDYVRPEGYDDVRLEGTPQVTRSGGVETGHAADSIAEALRLARTNEFSTIYFNRSFTHITGRAFQSLIRPDVVGVASPSLDLPFRYDAYESLSGRQTRDARQQEMPPLPGLRPLRGQHYKRFVRFSPAHLRKLGVRPLYL